MINLHFSNAEEFDYFWLCIHPNHTLIQKELNLYLFAFYAQLTIVFCFLFAK